MRVKKQIALLLSGAILTGSLAGCDRTIIEHQFFTEEIVENITRETTLQDLQDLIDGFGLKLLVAIDNPSLWIGDDPDDPDDPYVPYVPLREGGVCESISGDDIREFLECENFNNKFYLSAYEKMSDKSEFYVCFFDAVNQIYNALKDIPTVDLKATLDKYQADRGEDWINLYGRPCKDEDGALYVEVSIGYVP